MLACQWPKGKDCLWMRKNTKEIFQEGFVGYNINLRLEGLEHEVKIFRDQIGIAHIQAKTVSDAFFSQGFVHAQDRFWQMEFDRYRAYGRAAEIMGASRVNQDILWRKLLLEDNAKDDFNAGSEATRNMFRAYASGVNAYLSLGKFPPECQVLAHAPGLWAPWDSIAVFKARHLSMGRWEHKIWRLKIAKRFGAEAVSWLYPPSSHYRHLVPTWTQILKTDEEPQTPLPNPLDYTDSDEGGSNNWVLAGQRTVSGKPLVAGDPHRTVEIPGVYYQNHVTCPEFDVIGFSFPGVPGFPHFGHNPWVAWSITHTAADTQDVFVEDLSADVKYYRRGSTWHPTTTRQEVIRIRGADPRLIEVIQTDNGPIVHEQGNEYLALKLAALQKPNHTWDVLFDMLLAQNAEQFDEAMRQWVDPVNNLLFADVHGHIGYRMRGKLPIRPPLNAWFPVPADQTAYQWQGFVPFEAMPQQKNPSAGYLVTANNQAYDDSYPYYVSLDFAANHRAKRIEELIQKRTQWDANTTRQIHADIVSKAAQKFLAQLSQAHPTTPAGQTLQKQLERWDGTIRSDSILPRYYNTVRKTLVEDLMVQLTDNDFLQATRTVPATTWQASRLTGHLTEILGDPDSALGKKMRDLWPDPWGHALDKAAQHLKLIETSDSVRWGDIHVLKVAHPLSNVIREISPWVNPAPLPMSGDGDTVQAASYTLAGFDVTGSSVARYIFDLSNWNQSGWIIPFGVSGIGSHTHYDDQTDLWRHHKLYPMHFTKDTIEESARYRTLLAPVLMTDDE